MLCDSLDDLYLNQKFYPRTNNKNTICLYPKIFLKFINFPFFKKQMSDLTIDEYLEILEKQNYKFDSDGLKELSDRLICGKNRFNYLGQWTTKSWLQFNYR